MFGQTSIEDMLDELRDLNVSNPDKALEHINEIRNRQDELHSSELKASFYIKAGYYYLLKSDNLNASKELSKVLTLENVSLKRRLSAYNLLSQVEMGLQNYNEAFEYLYAALNIVDTEPDAQSNISLYHGAANIFLSIEAWDEALHYSNKAIVLATETDNLASECYALAQHYEIQTKLQAEPALIVDLKEVLEKCSGTKVNLILTNLHKNIGINYLETSDLINAKKHLLIAQDYLEKTPYLPEELEVLSKLAILDFSNEQLNSTLSKIEIILQSTKLDKLSKIRREGLLLKAKVLSRLGKLEESNEAMAVAYTANNEIKEDLASKSLAMRQVQYSNLDNETQVKLLNQENQLLKLNSEVQLQSTRIYQLISLLAAIFVALVILILFRVKKQKERYQELSRKDGLTGILSRRYVLDRASVIHDKFSSKAQEYSLIVFDLDYFKSINDRYGHAIGDWVLKQVTRKVSEQIREQDVFGRLGGEEFILILPATKNDNAVKLAERCLEAIKTIRHEQFASNYVLTASFGVATYPAYEELHELIQNADDAMYKAKQMGRNQIFSFAQ